MENGSRASVRWMVLLVVVLMWVCPFRVDASSGPMWYGRTLTASEEQAVMNKAAAEIQNHISDDVNCAVRIEAVYAAQYATPPAEALLGFMDGSITRDWAVRVRKRIQATTHCEKHFDCWGVAMFRSDPPQLDETTGEEIFFVRYMQRGSDPRLTGDDLETGGVWFASHILRRLDGYDCANPYVDTEWYRNTWHGRLDHVLPRSIPHDPPSIIDHFKRVGSQYGLWPNRECRLTPFLLTPESGCTVRRCPSHTICPEGFRQRDDTHNWCLAQVGKEQTYAEGVYDDSFLASHEGSFANDLPCNYNGYQASVGGFCGYDLGNLDGGNTAAVCVCHGTNTPSNDPACQINAADYCVSPLGYMSAVCNSEGTCALDMSKLDWEADNLNMATGLTHADIEGGVDPAVQCSCDNPLVSMAPWCDVSQCSSSESGTLRDCHNDPVPPGSPEASRGECLSGGDGSFSCFCNDFFFGEDCQHSDVFPDEVSGSTPGCFIDTVYVDVDIPGRRYAECSGHGYCGFRDVHDPDSTFCTCAPGYSGDYCQFSECGLCGPYGKCVRKAADATASGEFETECACVVDEATGVSLAAKDPSTGRCVVDLCLDAGANRYGTLSVNTTSMVSLSDPFAPPTGFCECTVMANGLQNAGTMCDEPVCDRDEHGWTCGIEFEAVVNKVCKACKDHPGLLQCGETSSTIGAVCDCEDVGRLASERPYWEADSSVDRFLVSTNEDDVGFLGFPLCMPYCVHGQWARTGVEEWGCTNCFQQGWSGDRCDVPFCLHGTYDPATMCVPGSCDPGWVGILCSECDPAFGVYRTGASRYDCSGCLAGWVHAGVDGAFASAALLANETCVPCAEASYCDAGGTETQTCHHDDAPVKITCECAPGYTGTVCNRCQEGWVRLEEGGDCISLSEHIGCDATGVSRTTQGNPILVYQRNPDTDVLVAHSARCVCRAGFDDTHRCGRCVDGFAWDDDACVPCGEVAGCYAPGTRRVVCESTRGGSRECECLTESGYKGNTCGLCTPDAHWDAHVGRCVKCGLECGPNGAPDCTASPPRCLCFNGFGGEDCSVCSECGHGGTCNSGAFFSGPWCTCAEELGWTKSSVLNEDGATEEDVRTSACDQCREGMIAFGGACTDIVQVCGPGADVEATQTLQSCVCASSFYQLSAQPTGKCDTCRGGGVGPHCVECPEACNVHSTCQWVSTPLVQGPQCVCNEGYVDSELGPCSQCDFPRYKGQYCNACPGDCGLGTCSVEPRTQSTYCSCPTGSRHQVARDSSSPCVNCPVGTTTRLCLPCPRCGPNSECLEQDGKAVCVCRPGFTRRPGHTRPADTCFDTEVLAAFLASESVPDDVQDLGYEPPEGADTAAQLENYVMWTAWIVVPGMTLFFLVGLAVFCMDAKRRRAKAAQEKRTRSSEAPTGVS